MLFYKICAMGSCLPKDMFDMPRFYTDAIYPPSAAISPYCLLIGLRVFTQAIFVPIDLDVFQ